jgi:maleate isomerase
MIARLEKLLRKPVVTSNQALAWHCLRIAGVEFSTIGFGRLLDGADSG